jgi:putative acetyltransferase
MRGKFEIRPSKPGDAEAIESIYPGAFPDEDLLPLVRDLLREPGIAMSLVAWTVSQIAGHALFTRCSVTGNDTGIALLGPLAVVPAWQKSGIGTALVKAGVECLKEEGVDRVCVLGDPGYYGRLGFVPETRVTPPCKLPPQWRDAWQSKSLDGIAASCSGRLRVPAQWRNPALWAP